MWLMRGLGSDMTGASDVDVVVGEVTYVVGGIVSRPFIFVSTMYSVSTLGACLNHDE